MATQGFPDNLSGVTANADISTKQFFIVKTVSPRKVDVCSSTSDKPIGVLQNKPTSAQSAQVQVQGIAKVKINSTVTAGDWIGTDGSGYGVTKTADHDIVIGQALISGVAGDIIEVLLTPGGHTLSA